MPEKGRPSAHVRRALAVQKLAHQEALALEKRGLQEHTANMMLQTAAMLQEAAKAIQPSNAATRRSPEDEPDSSPSSSDRSLEGYPHAVPGVRLIEDLPTTKPSTKRTLSLDDHANDLIADSGQSSRSMYKAVQQKIEEVHHVRRKSDLPDEKKRPTPRRKAAIE